jgi:hypothetical protein
MGAPTFNDFKNASPEELKKTYKLDSRQLEQAHRKVIDGGRREHFEKEYKSFYVDNRK